MKHFIEFLNSISATELSALISDRKNKRRFMVTNDIENFDEFVKTLERKANKQF